ncbi:glycosyltransferase family protein [Candidatus Nitrosacidococcus tergens]|uniref:Putative Glycosyl transferase family 1 n=1 Tax=Candidatus Nitrosacidococcus tergens TaxID=553981 RepID=A0A7G1QAB2_9GAMM|nr:glycosyltransferase family protein [Candidatus Nitrosacidococcus tergens]CAB1276547.1 putative Glycosyl transferase family 1 [Candidatus Nitrosacidococcus tergens]
MSHKVLFAVHDWGLGHATRDLVVIRALLDAGHEVGIVSYGRAMMLLRSMLANRCTFYELKDIPKPLGRYAATFYIRMSLAMPEVFWIYRKERLFAQHLCKTQGYDRIISDSRFGMALTEVPSYYLFHSLRQIIPGRPHWLEYFVERNQQHLLRRAQGVLIPDEEQDGGLAGDLCHNMSCNWGDQVKFIGPLADMEAFNVEKDIRCFISVSGAEPQRTILEEIILKQVKDLEGRIIVALGRPENPDIVFDNGRITIYGFLDRQQQIEMINRANTVVTRSGYTTLMELSQIGCKALLIPTVGQSEQEYLADYHRQRGYVHSVLQHQVNLLQDIAITESLPGLPKMSATRDSVQRLLSIVVG